MVQNVAEFSFPGAPVLLGLFGGVSHVTCLWCFYSVGLSFLTGLYEFFIGRGHEFFIIFTFFVEHE